MRISQEGLSGTDSFKATNKEEKIAKPKMTDIVLKISYHSSQSTGTASNPHEEFKIRKTTLYFCATPLTTSYEVPLFGSL